jgi:hypothetical protein
MEGGFVMKMFFGFMLGLSSVILMGADFNATEKQSLVGKAVESLGFKLVSNDDGKVGGDQNYTITDSALDKLKDTTVTIDSDGDVLTK